MIKRIIILTLNDLAIAFKNKTLFLIIFLPIFVFFVLKMVDTKDQQFQKINIGLIKDEAYSPTVIKSLIAADKNFNITYVDSKDSGVKMLKEKKLNGLLLESEELVVVKKTSQSTLAIIQSLNSLQQIVEGKKSWISSVTTLQTTDIQRESLPSWIILLLLLVGFFIIPTQIAEEKEKRLLLSLLQTPMREIEWLISKILMGMLLSNASILIIHLTGTFNFGFNLNYIIMLLFGSFCFSSYGIFVGFLCRNQASAKILGVAFYLPHLMPTILADFSEKMTAVAKLFPSYYLFESLKLILFEQVSITSLIFESSILPLVGVGTFSMSYFLIKRRWLM